MKEEENSLQLLLLNSGLFASKPVSYWTCAVIPAGGGGAEEAGRLTLQLPDGKMERPLERNQTFAGES